MKLKLKLLKPNPFRDLQIDPIDEEARKALRTSIKEYGFWSGTVVRKHNGAYETAAGWTRVLAAIDEGVEDADICVAPFDDDTMVRAYITENTTQRGNTATALAGAVATAMVQVAKALMISGSRSWGNFLNLESPTGVELARGKLMNGTGVGNDLITRYLAGVPGINSSVIKTQIALLKSSGQYQRLMAEIAQEVKAAHAGEAEEVRKLEEEEAKAPGEPTKIKVRSKLAKKPLYVARKTEENVAKQPITFDQLGVSKYFKNDWQINAFKKAVESAGVAPILPVENQAALAAAIVKEAKDAGRELSGVYIRDLIGIKAGDTKFQTTLANKKVREEALRTRARDNFKEKAARFTEDVRRMGTVTHALLDLIKQNPAISFEVPLHLEQSIKRAIELAHSLDRAIKPLKAINTL